MCVSPHQYAYFISFRLNIHAKIIERKIEFSNFLHGLTSKNHLI